MRFFILKSLLLAEGALMFMNNAWYTICAINYFHNEWTVVEQSMVEHTTQAHKLLSRAW